MIKERIIDFEQCISLLKMIRENIDDSDLIPFDKLINKLTELKEIFILSVTYNEVD